MVGYISETEGYVRGLLVPEANEYEKNNPDTDFIFINGYIRRRKTKFFSSS